MVNRFQILLANSTCAATIWKSLMLVTGSESPVVVVLSGRAVQVETRGLHSSTFRLNVGA